MIRTTLATCMALMVLLVSVVGLATPAKAFDPIGTVCNNGGGDSAVCKDRGNGSTNPLTGSDGLILKAAYLVSGVAGLAAVIIIIIAGLSYISSGGDPAKTKAAKTTIINTIIGLAVILLASSIISLIVSRL